MAETETNLPEVNTGTGKKTNRQKLLTAALLTGILLVCLFIGWLIYNRKDVVNQVAQGVFMPDINFRFAIGGEGSKGEYLLSEPMGVDIADNGDIYVVDTLNSAVKVFDRDGNFKIKFGGKNNLYLPTDAAVTGDSVFIADPRNSRIQVFNLNGRFKTSIAGSEIGKKIGAWMPAAITITANGDIYTADIFYQRAVIIDKNGKIKNYFGVPGSGQGGQLMYPNGIAVDRAGNVYVADSNNNRIQVFDANGKFLNTLTQNGKPLSLGMPRGMAFGAKNFLYVAETFTHRLRVLEVNRDSFDNTMTVGSRGVGYGEMNFPNDVAVKKNMLCIADRANNRILVYSLNE